MGGSPSMVRFVHTADWQIGMPARFLPEETAVRFASARLEALVRLGRLAREQACAFVLVCGDAFDSNLVSRRTVHQVRQALADMGLPVYILPGNHDALDPATVYAKADFLHSLPAAVHVLGTAGVVEAAAGVEIVAAPWASKRPTEDLAGAACRSLPRAPDGTLRILAAHGAVDVWNVGGGVLPPATIRLAVLEQALSGGVVHYVALGDRHSTTPVGRTGRVWYPGAPEVTAFDEVDSGQALIVELGAGTCAVRPVRVGRWRFLAHRHDVTGAAGVESLEGWLEGLPDKAETVVRLEVDGTVDLEEDARLAALVERFADVLGGLQLAGTGVAVLPSTADLDRLTLGGFAASALAELRRHAEAPGGAVALDALKLAFRLEATRP